jgi:hypothetical protein
MTTATTRLTRGGHNSNIRSTAAGTTISFFGAAHGHCSDDSRAIHWTTATAMGLFAARRDSFGTSSSLSAFSSVGLFLSSTSWSAASVSQRYHHGVDPIKPRRTNTSNQAMRVNGATNVGWSSMPLRQPAKTAPRTAPSPLSDKKAIHLYHHRQHQHRHRQHKQHQHK